MTRRTIVKSAAWSIPVIAASTAVPAYAASPGCTTGQTYTAPAPTAQANTAAASAAVTTNWTVPPGVTTVQFVIAGAGGGGEVSDPQWANTIGGSGGLVSGQLLVTPGTVLTLVVGQGGAFPLSLAGPALGGQGYGNGGNGSTYGGGTSRPAGGGGGGSAILIGADPVVVAGGGGGGGAGMSAELDTWIPITVSAGNAEQDGQDWLVDVSTSGWTATAFAGKGATASGPGAGGAVPTTTSPFQTWRTVVGNPGVGHNGGNGIRIRSDYEYGTASGGGGGGYFGGGSGSGFYAYGTPYNGPGYDMVVVGAPGGGGSNFVASNTVGGAIVAAHTVGTAGNNGVNVDTRHPGWITLTYGCE